jgi:aldose 1-epimerase
VITLRKDGAELDLLPEVGGAVGRFAVRGREVLRPTPAGTTDVLQTSCFPLVPFANRIAHGTFVFRGDMIRLPRNFGDHPHALHGQGWQSAWRVESQSAAAAVLVFDHPAGDWPWDYTARQTFSLAPDALRVELRVTNRSARPMPASLGFHPYFARTAQTRLTAHVAGVWLSDESLIPTAPAEPAHFLDLAHGTPLAATPFVDHCHFGWRSDAVIEQPEDNRALRLSASAGLLHLYIPQMAQYFCVEPVSAMPDAFNRAEPADISGLRVIESGESFAIAMTLRVVAHPA